MGDVLLIIGGGIAAYKSLDVIRRLRERGVGVRCVLTAAGSRFVTPLSITSLSADKVFCDLFSLTDEVEMSHIRLSREADLVVVAPATADLMAKMAHGLADDLASTALLASDKTILLAPAMNPAMWQHPATRRNVEQLVADGVRLVGPNAGDMACGETGPGRMAEPDQIVAAILHCLRWPDRPLAGVRALVTSGPTLEAIDPVRVIANRSSGRQGHAIADALAAAGAEVVLVSGPVKESAPYGVDIVRVESAEEMLQACRAALPVDVAVCVAALDHVMSPRKVLAEIARVLKPQGWFILGIHTHHPLLLGIRRTLERVTPRAGSVPHPNVYTEAELRADLREHFTTVSAECVYGSCRHAGMALTAAFHRKYWVFTLRRK